MSEGVVIGIAVVVLAPLLPYLAGPALIYRTFWFSGDPDLRLIDPDELPDGVLVYMDEQARRMGELGFEEVGWLTLAGFVPNAVTHFFVLRKPAERVAAMVAVSYSMTEGRVKEDARYIEFSSEDADGRSINTNNNAELMPGPMQRYKTTLHLPRVRDASELYRVHGKLVDHAAPSRSSLRPPPGEERMADELRGMLRRDLERLMEAGYLRRGGDGVKHRPTWKGAVLMTWGQLWPITWIRRTLRARRNRRMLETLGVRGEDSVSLA